MATKWFAELPTRASQYGFCMYSNYTYKDIVDIPIDYKFIHIGNLKEIKNW